MKWLKCVLALALLLGSMAPDVASADRGGDARSFQPRHEVFKHRHDGRSFQPRHEVFKHRHDGRSFQPRHEVFKHRHDGARFRDDFIRHRGSTFSHSRDVFRHDQRILRHHQRPLDVRGGHHRRHHSHSHLGVFIGTPLYWNWPPPYYAYPPPVVAVPSSPPVYIERGNDEVVPAQGYWYYCYNPDGYYPYVRECPGGWERVAPTPPR